MRVLLRLLAPLLGLGLAAAGLLLVIEVVAAWVRSPPTTRAAGAVAASGAATLESLTWAERPVPAIAVGGRGARAAAAAARAAGPALGHRAGRPGAGDHRDHLAAGAGPAGRAPGARRRGRGQRRGDREPAPGGRHRAGLDRPGPAAARRPSRPGWTSCSTSCRCSTARGWRCASRTGRTGDERGTGADLTEPGVPVRPTTVEAPVRPGPPRPRCAGGPGRRWPAPPPATAGSRCCSGCCCSRRACWSRCCPAGCSGRPGPAGRCSTR